MLLALIDLDSLSQLQDVSPANSRTKPAVKLRMVQARQGSLMDDSAGGQMRDEKIIGTWEEYCYTI